MKGIIYHLIDPRFPKEIRYVGITSRDPKFRIIEHIKEAKYYKKNTHKLNWIRKLLSEGVEPIMCIDDEFSFTNIEEYFLKEIESIQKYKYQGHNLVNSTIGGRGCLGVKASEETKKLLSNKGKLQWEKMSKEERDKRHQFNSNRLKGNSFRKNKKDPQSRIDSKKIQYKGKNNGNWKGYWIQIDTNFNKVKSWESIKEAADFLKITYKSIWSASRKFTKKGLPYKAGGFYWKQEKYYV